MWAWITLTIFIISVVIGGILVLGPKRGLSTPDWAESVIKLKDEVLGETSVTDYPQELVKDQKESLREGIKDQTSTVVEVINQKTTEVLGEKTQEKVEVEVVVNPPGESSNEEVINLSLGKKLSLKKGVLYSFKFPQIPDGYCLFVNNQKYEVSEGSIIKMRFTNSGNFPLKLDYCQPTQKDFGEITVD